MSYALVEVSWFDNESLSGLECHGVFDSEDKCQKKKEELQQQKRSRRQEIIDNAEKFMDQWKADSPEKYEEFFRGMYGFHKSRLAEHLANVFSVNYDLSLFRQKWGVTVDQFKNPYSYDDSFQYSEFHILEVPSEHVLA